jgi:hypothetical protein
LKNPINTSLAVEIKLLDDQIAECVQLLQRSNATSARRAP